MVGKNASYDGSTLVARNEDSSNGVFEPKRMRVVHPDEQPRVYTSVLSHLTVELPDNPMRYTSVPDVVPGHGIWAEAGFNELNVGMSATETLTTNERVRGADPLVDYVPAKGNEDEDGYVPAQPGGLGEEEPCLSRSSPSRFSTRYYLILFLSVPYQKHFSFPIPTDSSQDYSMPLAWQSKTHGCQPQRPYHGL